MSEAVRLVVWDLDDTFWKGTVTEGGIQEYVQAHHDIVIELARRGIMSSICSKNDAATIREILAERGILEYFIFPSISWEPKGARIAQLAEAVQLRPASMLFIDDNPNNRAEAAAVVPGLQVEDEKFISTMLADPRFKGKDDRKLTRLNQYKLLEQRKRDEQQTPGNNEEFLRGCDVRVYIEYAIEPHIDRVIELVNRTNQLNYTKKRFPEDPEAARAALREQMSPFDSVCGLVRVIDKYGDYGFVGFFLTVGMRSAIEPGAANTRLNHFCFSCRTLGMLIEQWVYDYLGRPELIPVGEVLTDLSVRRQVDWVRLVTSVDDTAAAHPQIAPHIVLYGGCEANAIGAYLNANTKKLDILGNYVANGLFVSIDFAARVVDVSDRHPDKVAAELAALGLPPSMETGDIFSTAAPGALFVFNLGIDAQGSDRLRHKIHGWTFVLSPSGFGSHLIFSAPEKELTRVLSTAASFTDEQRQHIVRVSRHLRAHYEQVAAPNEIDLVEDIRDIIARIPTGSRLIFLIPHDQFRPSGAMDELRTIERISRYRDMMKALIVEFPYAALVLFSAAIATPTDIVKENHYGREVYLRLGQEIAKTAATIPPRVDAPLPRPRAAPAEPAAKERMRPRAELEARNLVYAAFEDLFRRKPDAEAERYFVTALAENRLTPAEFLRAITGSQEFGDKWRKT